MFYQNTYFGKAKKRFKKIRTGAITYDKWKFYQLTIIIQALLNGDIGLKELFQKQNDDILEIKINSDDILKELDTPEDYEKITRQALCCI